MKQTAHDPRKAVLRRLAESYDRFAEAEQLAVADGYYDVAQEQHELAVLVLRAYAAEADDPEPPRMPR